MQGWKGWKSATFLHEQIVVFSLAQTFEILHTF